MASQCAVRYCGPPVKATRVDDEGQRKQKHLFGLGSRDLFPIFASRMCGNGKCARLQRATTGRSKDGLLEGVLDGLADGVPDGLLEQ